MLGEVEQVALSQRCEHIRADKRLYALSESTARMSAGRAFWADLFGGEVAAVTSNEHVGRDIRSSLDDDFERLRFRTLDWLHEHR